ncbi:hypothetical protein QQ045_008766 [Rhodiola kirilowii]
MSTHFKSAYIFVLIILVVYTIATLQFVVSQNMVFIDAVCMLSTDSDKCTHIMYSAVENKDVEAHVVGLKAIELARNNVTGIIQVIRQLNKYVRESYELRRLEGCMVFYKGVMRNLEQAEGMWNSNNMHEARVATRAGIKYLDTCRQIYGGRPFVFERRSGVTEFLLNIFVIMCDVVDMMKRNGGILLSKNS